jgi:hypothetical protein
VRNILPRIGSGGRRVKKKEGLRVFFERRNYVLKKHPFKLRGKIFKIGYCAPNYIVTEDVRVKKLGAER